MTATVHQLKPRQENLIEPPEKVSKAKPLRTMRIFMAERQKAGLPLIDKNHAVFKEAKKMGIPMSILEVGWYRFMEMYMVEDPEKKYRDWHLTFLKAIKGNWMKVWILDAGEYRLTNPVGLQAEKSMKAKKKENADKRKASTENPTQ